MTGEWERIRLDELTEGDSPITYGVVKPGSPGDVLFIRGGDLSDGRVLEKQLRTITSKVSEQYKRTLLRGGELLICLVGQPGQVAIAPRALAGANIARQVGLIRLRSVVNAEFISYFLRSPVGQASLGTYTGGSVQQVINLGDLRTVNVPLPPLPEQRRIVGILDEAFEGIATTKANAEKNLQNARALFESHLQSVFTQRGKGWKMERLSDICLLINGRAYKQEEMLKNGKYPLLRVGNFFTNKDWFYSDLELEPEKYCDNGDLLYCWSASFGPRIWGGRKVIYHYHIWKVLPRPTIVEKRFLLHLLEWDVEQIKQAHGTGTTMMHVGKGSMENRIVPVAPLQEQGSIVATLDELEKESKRLESIYERKLIALESLKKSLLNQAFTSNL